jgi:CheY-like chemotaxis protein
MLNSPGHEDLFDLVWIVRCSVKGHLPTKRIPSPQGDVHLIEYWSFQDNSAEPVTVVVAAVVSQSSDGTPLLHLSLAEELDLVSSVPRVLLLEEDPDLRWLMGQMLESVGFLVTPVASGEEFLEHAQMSVPDVIVLDVDLPEEDGYRICRELNGDPRTARIPVVLCSGRVDLLNERATEAGAAATISKPTEVRRLAECLRRLLWSAGSKLDPSDVKVG